jgi:hypothetical protein
MSMLWILGPGPPSFEICNKDKLAIRVSSDTQYDASRVLYRPLHLSDKTTEKASHYDIEKSQTFPSEYFRIEKSSDATHVYKYYVNRYLQ